MTITVPEISELSFEAPAPGSWRIAAGPMPRPWPRFQTEIHPEQLTKGFRATGRRYGLLLEAIEYRFLHGFAYMSTKMVDDSQIPERCEQAERAFGERLWRHDMDRWDADVKPAATAANLELQAVDPASLSTPELLDHIARCRKHYMEMVYEQHFHNGAALIPLGDFLAHAEAWTGRPLGELVEALRGAAPVSAGASPVRARVVGAIKADAAARDLLLSEKDPVRSAGSVFSGLAGVLRTTSTSSPSVSSSSGSSARASSPSSCSLSSDSMTLMPISLSIASVSSICSDVTSSDGITALSCS